jgi:hypothetical protein
MLVIPYLICYTQFAFALSKVFRSHSTQKKEGFIDRVDIVSFSSHDPLFRRKGAQSIAWLEPGQGVRWEGGNSWPLFLIALEKAVRP